MLSHAPIDHYDFISPFFFWGGGGLLDNLPKFEILIWKKHEEEKVSLKRLSQESCRVGLG